jgi:hypothetical protein
MMLQLTTPGEVHKLISEGSRLKVVPLLQMFLPFPDNKVTSLTAAAKNISMNGIAAAASTNNNGSSAPS